MLRLLREQRMRLEEGKRRLLNNAQDIIVLDLDETQRGSAGAGEGKELDLAILFADIRDFTATASRAFPMMSCTC